MIVNLEFEATDITYNVAEASKRGFGTQYEIRKAIKNGNLPAAKSGRFYSIKISDLIIRFGRPRELRCPRLLGISDIAKRWGMSRQAVHKRMNSDTSFPKPVAKINANAAPVFLEFDIANYEIRLLVPSTKQRAFIEENMPIEYFWRRHPELRPRYR